MSTTALAPHKAWLRERTVWTSHMCAQSQVFMIVAMGAANEPVVMPATTASTNPTTVSEPITPRHYTHTQDVGARPLDERWRRVVSHRE